MILKMIWLKQWRPIFLTFVPPCKYLPNSFLLELIFTSLICSKFFFIRPNMLLKNYKLEISHVELVKLNHITHNHKNKISFSFLVVLAINKRPSVPLPSCPLHSNQRNYLATPDQHYKLLMKRMMILFHKVGNNLLIICFSLLH